MGKTEKIDPRALPSPSDACCWIVTQAKLLSQFADLLEDLLWFNFLVVSKGSGAVASLFPSIPPTRAVKTGLPVRVWPTHPIAESMDSGALDP